MKRSLQPPNAAVSQGADMIDSMSFGAGVQSTCIMTLACEGHIPMPRHWVFADPGAETQATYVHLERCKEYLACHGAELITTSAGNIETEAIEFAHRRSNSEVRRYASIPLFVQNLDGSHGVLPRQCTTEYKIEPLDALWRQAVLGLAHRQHAPKEPAVNVWIGISADEAHRANAAGKWKNETAEVGKDLLGEPITVKRRTWVPCKWQVKSFPLLGIRIYPDRTRESDDRFAFCTGWDRDDCLTHLAKVWPYPVPRSACTFCPYRSNREWADMKANAPADFARAVVFDYAVREGYRDGQDRRGHSAGVPYVHRSRVPLDLVDFSEKLPERKGCCGLFDEEPDGICGV